MNRRTMIFAALIALAGCKGSGSSGAASQGAKPDEALRPAPPSPASAAPIALNGAGATFPYPLYSKWTSEYGKAHPDIRINYQSIGSGGGIRQIVAGTVDFGATDAPMKDDEAKQAPGKILHIPMTIGAVVVAYNVAEATAPLKLTPDLLADIYLGKIRKWSEKRIKEQNPALKLPDKDISVLYRSDGSGTSAVFTEYLAKVSAEWKDKVGAGKSVKWPVGLGAKGNEGVTGQLKTTPYSLGYIEKAFASQNKLAMAEVRNKAGKFVAPTTAAMSAAAVGVAMPESLCVTLADSAGEDAYPITGYTYLLVYEDSKDKAKGAALAKFLAWAVREGQSYSADLDYAPLPAPVVAAVEARLKTLRSGDQKLLGEP